MTGPLERLDASEYGDPEDYRGGVAPPCEECGEREAVEDGLCGRCSDREE